MENEVTSIIWANFWNRVLTLAFLGCVLSVGDPDILDAIIHWLMK
jgi:hypothetical protein